MQNIDYEVQDEFLNGLADMVRQNKEAVIEAGYDEAVIDVLSNLTPSRRDFIHANFFELFEFAPGQYEKMRSLYITRRGMKKSLSWLMSIILIFLLAAGPCKLAYAELIVTPDALSDIWYRDNKIRVAHNFMAISDRQLAMQSNRGLAGNADMMAIMDFGKEDVLYPTTTGMRTGRIDGLSFNAVGYEYALYLERLQISDNENHQSYPKDSWIEYSNYAGMMTFHYDGWLLSAGILSKTIPVQRDNMFVNHADSTGDSESTELLLHLNYHGLQLSTYIDKEDANSYYSKYSNRLFGFWNNEIFYDNYSSDKNLLIRSSKELAWHTAFEIADNVQAGYTLRYGLDTDHVLHTSYSIRYKVFNAEYIKYDEMNPYRLDDYGYNVELKLYEENTSGLALGRRRNYSEHTGMFVNDYTITTLTFKLHF